jgi:hypothetical protein
MYSRTLAVVFVLSFAEAAAAQARNEANPAVAACVAKLSADGQLIFSTARPELSPATELRTLVRATAVRLVGTGKVSQTTAPDAALAAAACLELLPK